MSNEMNIEAIYTLGSHMVSLNKKDQTFADSLIKQYAKKGHLSEKQWYWIDVLVDRATEVDTKPEPVKAALGDISGVLALFDKAAEHLKYPKIHLVDPDGNPVVLAVAGPKSQFTGQINVTDGGPFKNNKWYGRIDLDGVWTKGYVHSETVATLLWALANDPAAVAKESAKLTGKCCFCNHSLHGEDEVSVQLGYGPTCAKHFGLPWGKKVVDGCTTARSKGEVVIEAVAEDVATAFGLKTADVEKEIKAAFQVPAELMAEDVSEISPEDYSLAGVIDGEDESIEYEIEEEALKADLKEAFDKAEAFTHSVETSTKPKTKKQFMEVED